jgi:hypothetical protein
MLPGSVLFKREELQRRKFLIFVDLWRRQASEFVPWVELRVKAKSRVQNRWQNGIARSQIST